MIDYFALALCHGLLLVALIRLARRDDVDSDAALENEVDTLTARERRQRRRAMAGGKADARKRQRHGGQTDA